MRNILFGALEVARKSLIIGQMIKIWNLFNLVLFKMEFQYIIETLFYFHISMNLRKNKLLSKKIYRRKIK